MRFGINTFLFTSPFTDDSTKWFKTFKSWGFDSVEIAVEHESHIDPTYVKSELDRNGLVAELCVGPSVQVGICAERPRSSRRVSITFTSSST